MVLESLVHSSSYLLVQIGVVIIVATLFAFIAKLFRQPLIPAYIITGVILGPLVFGLINDLDLVKSLSEIGIAFLLFVVGLEIDIKKLKEVGWIASIGGLFQVLLVFLLGYYVSTSLGFKHEVSLYLGIALSFSSTMVVVKLLSDKSEIDTLHGRIILGFLLMQDLIAMIVLALMLGIGDGFSWLVLLPILIKSLVLLLLALVSSWFIFPRLFDFAAKSKEFLFLSSVTVCFLFALVADVMDFSIAIGAFIAGVALAPLPYATDVKGRVEPIKDFFATIFFVSLGVQLVFTGLGSMIELILIFLSFILFLKPLLIFILGILFGYSSQVSFTAGVYLAQISEFSLILISSALVLGNVSAPVFSLIVLLMALSVVTTSYFIEHAHSIYGFQKNFLEWFERFSIVKREKLEYGNKSIKKSAVLLGCGKMGMMFIETLKKLKQDVVILDNNPKVIQNLMTTKINCRYGDATSRVILESLNLKSVKIIISTIPDLKVNQFVLNYIKFINPEILVILTANRTKEVLDLYDLGADYVIVPRVISGSNISEMLLKVFKSKKNLGILREENLRVLEKLQSLGMG